MSIPPSSDDEQRDAQSVAWKSLALGACSIIVLLCGSLFGYLLNDLRDQAKINADTNLSQWRKLGEINDRTIELSIRQQAVLQAITDFEERLRALERAHKGH